MTHNHYASTDLDPTCDLCAAAVVFRPLEPAPTLSPVAEATWVAQPKGFKYPVRIRRFVTEKGEARFYYWGRALRWIPIARDVAAMAIADAVANGATPKDGE